ncbi:beta barrel domain-containing protein [Bacillus mojavensis]
MKIEVGVEVFLKPTERRGRTITDDDILERTILKVGRKYFHVGIKEKPDHRMIKFEIDGLMQATDYSPDWEVYFSKQDIFDEEKRKDLLFNIRSKFNRYVTNDLSLDQLKRINEIINESKKGE